MHRTQCSKAVIKLLSFYAEVQKHRENSFHSNFDFNFSVRNTTPNQPFLKSPSPSAPSPMGGNLPNQMIPSPALVQMVPSPQVANIMTQRNGMSYSIQTNAMNEYIIILILICIMQ